MCGLIGMIFGKHSRTVETYDNLADIFARLIMLSERRGPHATGAALLSDRTPAYVVKDATQARHFITSAAFNGLCTAIGDDSTLLMGHVRYRTRGTEQNNANNHPIVAGDIIGIHNGTIDNADDVFRKFNLPRVGEVDSEVIFRLAERQLTTSGSIGISNFRKDLKSCAGSMSAIMAAATCPQEVVICKGDKPLSLCYHEELRVIVIASEACFLDAVLVNETGWKTLRLPEYHMMTLRTDSFPACDVTPFTLRLPEPRRYRQISVDDYCK